MNKYTDQEFTYRQVPVSYDGIAKLDSIKGNTLVWNQLVQNGNFVDTSNWAPNNVTLTASNNVLDVKCARVGSASYSNIIQHGLPFVKGHKYLYSYDINPLRSKDVRIYFIATAGSGGSNLQRTASVTAGVWNTFAGIIEMPTDIPYDNFQIAFNMMSATGYEVDDIDKVRNCKIFDLTQMFGSGNEPATVEEFTALFPLPYYAYNTGTLLSFNGTGVKTTGKNLINIAEFVQRSGYSNLSVSQANNVITVSGYSSGGRFACFNVPLIIGKQYTIKLSARNNVTGVSFVQSSEKPTSWVGSGTSIGINAPVTFTANNPWLQVVIEVSADNATVTDLQLELGSSATSYEPYTSSTSSLPISTYFPTGMKSAGSVFDELTNSKAITRIGEVDLGTLAWYYDSDNARFTTRTVGKKNGWNNIVCANYSLPPTSESVDFGDKMIKGFSANDNIAIKDSTYGSDASALTTALSGVKLYYELETPTEQDINADLFYKFYGNGTEEVLPVNTDTPSTSPLLADIIYYNTFDSDVPYRKFWFANGNGEEWSLTEKDFKAFLNNPSGLGFKKSIDMVRYGERAVKNSEVYDLPTVTGDLLFYDTANSSRYDRYNEFVRFLMDQPIKLYYQIPVSYSSQIADLYTLDCEVSELRKTESKPEGLLTSNITINGLSFYEGEEVVISGSSTTISIENKGDFAVGFEITIEGTMTNPYFTLEQDEELYGEGRFVDSTAFNSVYVNSNDGEQDLVLQQNGSILPNPLSYQDLSISNGAIYVTFVKLARGVSELKVRGGTISNVTVRFKPMFRSV